MSRRISTLPGITRFQSGVGDRDDLLVRLKEDAGGGWFPLVHTGFYYIGTEEGYLYASPGAATFTVGVTGSVQTVVVNNFTRDPTRLGPIRLTRAGSSQPLQRVCSPLRAFRPLAYTGGGDVQTALVPTSGLLVSVVSDPVTGIMLSVPATGDIADISEYVYRPETGEVFFRNPTPPSLYVTYLVGEQDPDRLRQEEVLVVDRDGLLRTQFSPVFCPSGHMLRPQIGRPLSTGTIAATGISAVRNAVTLSSPALCPSGSLVRVQYYAWDSFTAVLSGTSLVVQLLPAATGTFTLEYETGLSAYYDPSQLASGAVNYLELNPMLSPRESGFLYMADVNEAWPRAARLRLDVSNRNPLLAPSGAAAVIFAVTALDAEGEPLPQAALTVAQSGAIGLLSLISPTLPITDAKGQVRYRFTPQATGTTTFTATVTGTSVSGTLDLRCRALSYYTAPARQQLGKLFLNLEAAPYRDRLYRLNAYYCYPDGVPLQPDSAANAAHPTVTFRAERSVLYDQDGRPLGQSFSANLDDDGIAAVLVDPQPGDTIRAEVQTSATGRFRTAAPVRIPEAPSN